MKSRLQFSAQRTLLLHLLLVVSLVLAQAAAYAHISAHLKNPTDPSGIAGKAAQLCSECLEGAPLLGAAGTPCVPSISQVVAADAPAPAFACAPLERRSHYAFRSRAPPAFL